MRGRIVNPPTSKHGSTEILEEDFLGNFSIDFALMEVPNVNLVLPSKYAKFLTGNTIIQLRNDDWVYEGYIEEKSISFQSHTVSLATSHILGRLAKRKVPTNVTMKGKSAKDVLEKGVGYWDKPEYKEDIVNQFTLTYVDDYPSKSMIEFEFSNETLLEFFTKVCEKTTSMYWRISKYDPYQIDFGIFGKQRNILINEYNYLISLDDVKENYSELINEAVVMSDKSDGGASSLTMRDIFYNKGLMIEGFPVVMTGHDVNTQRQYDYVQIPVFAPEIIGDEFAIIDEEGVALEGGEIYWGTITTNDTQSVANTNKEVTDKDRIEATKQLYYSAIRKLKNSRRRITYSMTVEPLPKKAFQVGDMVIFKLDEGITELTACSNYYEKILRESDWFYVTKVQYDYSEGNALVQQLEISKFLYSDRDLFATS